MSVAKILPLALCTFLLGAPGAVLAQADKPDKQIDLKPLLPPIVPPVFPPNSILTPGGVGNTTLPPYSTGSSFDQTQSAPAPGFRLTIPTR